MARALEVILTLLSVIAFAAASDYACSNSKTKSLLALLGDDTSIQKFCAALPSNNGRLDRSKCPKALRNAAYDEIKSFCERQKKVCTKPACKAPTPDCCSKSTCGKYCANLKTDVKNCGACGNKCGSYQYCHGGRCKPGNGQATTRTSKSTTTRSTTAASTTTASTTAASTTAASTTPSMTTPPATITYFCARARFETYNQIAITNGFPTDIPDSVSSGVPDVNACLSIICDSGNVIGGYDPVASECQRFRPGNLMTSRDGVYFITTAR